MFFSSVYQSDKNAISGLVYYYYLLYYNHNLERFLLLCFYSAIVTFIGLITILSPFVCFIFSLYIMIYSGKNVNVG